MNPTATNAEDLRRQIQESERNLQLLKDQLQNLEKSASPIRHDDFVSQTLGVTTVQHDATNDDSDSSEPWSWPLAEDEYTRYGRQLILPTVGIDGQLRLKAASVLLVGAGGLGCPAAAYLAGAGVGTIGIVDGDTVEASNLHRQIAHSTSRIGQYKVDSLVSYCRGLNPLPTYKTYAQHLTPQNAPDIMSEYDIVLDCTDHPTSRYLISDSCVLLGKPLVSASALRTDGQLIVLNNPPAPQGAAGTIGGPCYRCVFPKPPPADSVVSCGEGGILGPVVGVMGVLQALEAIKLITSGNIHYEETAVLNETEEQKKSIPTPSLLLFSASSPTSSFRSIRMRSRRPDCFACSTTSTLTVDTLRSGSLDYIAFCGVTTPTRLLAPSERVKVTEYRDRTSQAEGHLLLDVREKEHFDIASIPGAINIPYSKFQAELRRQQAKNKHTESQDATTSATTHSTLDKETGLPAWLLPQLSLAAPHAGQSSERELAGPKDLPSIYVICRVGNDSQLVTRKLKDLGLDDGGKRFIGDIEGGMAAWKRDVDPTMPFT